MKKMLQIGLQALFFSEWPHYQMTHVPLIEVIPRPLKDVSIQKAFNLFSTVTHLLFTSKQAVEIFLTYAAAHSLSVEQMNLKRIGAIGTKTAARLQRQGISLAFTAVSETLEGVITALESEDLRQAFVLWPRSSLSRPILIEWLEQKQIAYHAPPFYDTITKIPTPLPDLTQFDEVLFTSPSTINAFLAAYHQFPAHLTYRTIGPITEAHFKHCFSS